MNAGSSSLKLRVLGADDEVLAEADPDVADGAALADFVLGEADAVDAVGHRVVHGGARHVAPALVDDALLRALDELIDLAPLHQPPALAAIRQVAELRTDLPSVACFDTAFHATIGEAAATLPVPAAWRERYGVRRFGFHGLSVAHATRRAAELLGAPPQRLVVCHLGSGSSITAVRDGRSVDTTMGYTPNAGVPMATRAGSLDADLLAVLLARGELLGELVRALQHDAGLAGIAGTGDLRILLRRAGGGGVAEQVDPVAARLAIEVWVLRVAQAIAAMATAAGGLDALVFTGGVGEHQPELRRHLIDAIAWLGVFIDEVANAEDGTDRLISRPGAAVAVMAVRAREDIEIARAVRWRVWGIGAPPRTG